MSVVLSVKKSISCLFVWKIILFNGFLINILNKIIDISQNKIQSLFHRFINLLLADVTINNKSCLGFCFFLEKKTFYIICYSIITIESVGENTFIRWKNTKKIFFFSLKNCFRRVKGVINSIGIYMDLFFIYSYICIDLFFYFFGNL